MLTADPMIPPGLWVTLALAGLVLLAVYGWRRPQGISPGRWRGILALMAVAMALVLLLLLNFTWRMPLPPPPGKPLLTILVDSSASMATRDVGTGATAQSRYAAAAGLAAKIEKATGPDVEVRIRRFDEKTTAASSADLAKVAPDGEATDIAESITESLESDRPQGQAVVLLTDGIQSESAGGGAAKLRAAAQSARAAGAAIYGVVLGGQGGGVDVSIASHGGSELAFVRQKATLVADVRTHGYTGTVTVRLLADGKEIDHKLVDAAAGKPASAKFEVSQEKPGVYPYELQVEPAPGTEELTKANNSALCLLRVVDKPVRVLLVEGKPYWDSKFLTRQLAADASIELRSLVQVAPGRVLERVVARDAAASAPATASTQSAAMSDHWNVMREPEKLLADPAVLRDCQILVLGRDAESFLSADAVANLQRWLSRDGGALVCYRGSPEGQMDAGLSRLLPVKWQPSSEARYQIKLTDMGRNLDWFGGEAEALAGLPALASDTRVEQTKPLAVVVAQAQWQGRNDSPAVTYQPYGAGRVVVIEGAGMWRWAFPPAKTIESAGSAGTDQVYASVWHALFRWVISGAGLVPGEEAAIRPDKVAFASREPAAATVLVRLTQGAATQKSGALAVQLKGAAIDKSFPCEPSPEDPGAYRVQFGVLPAGRYTAALADGQATAVFDVRQFGEEELNLTARPDVLQLLATDSGGAVLQPSQVENVAARMTQNLAASRQQRVSFATAWDRVGVFIVILALWATAWALRRSSGLI